MARECQSLEFQLSVFLEIELANIRKAGSRTHAEAIHKVISKLPYVQAKWTIKQGFMGKFIRPLTSVFMRRNRKFAREPVCRKSVRREFDGSFKIDQVDSGAHPGAACHRSRKEV